MSKIDTSGIDGYAEMTAEQKLAALEAYEIAEPDLTGFIKKDKFDKTASELAEANKKLKLKMTEDEQKEAERATKEAERDALLAELQKDKAISDAKAQFLALGYEASLADEVAKATADGDQETIFAGQKRHLEAVEKRIRAEILKNTPTPPSGKTPEDEDEDPFITAFKKG